MEPAREGGKQPGTTVNVGAIGIAQKEATVVKAHVDQLFSHY